MRILTAVTSAALCVAFTSTTSLADDVEDALSLALDAYRAGDIKTAQEEVAFASQVLSQMKAAGLNDFLPDAPEGWVRELSEGTGYATTALGGGSLAEANYRRDEDGTDAFVRIMVGGQLVGAMAGMFSNTAMLGTLGQVRRINRQQVVIANEGEIQSLVDNRIMITIGGDATLEVKESLFSAINLQDLARF